MSKRLSFTIPIVFVLLASALTASSQTSSTHRSARKAIKPAAAKTHNSLTPTAEEVSISGRVLTAAGEGIPGTPVTVSGGGLTSPTSVRASATGDYRFDRLRPGLTYIISVRAKHHVFTNPARPVLVTDDVANFDFVAQP
jgi:ABC-type oligopeptide transport system substrate-binding subunit